MNLPEILHRLDLERRTLCLDSELLDHLPTVTRLHAKNNTYHAIIFSTLTPETADTAIATEIDHHRHLNVDFEWKLYAHDTPPDLLTRLRSHGLTPGPIEAVLVCDLTHPPAWLHHENTAHIKRIETLAEVETYCHLERAIFPDTNGKNADALAHAVHTHSTQHRAYIAYANNQPVAAARLYTHPQSHFAGLYGGTTLATHRHRGHYRALLAARAKDALHSGAHYLLVDALPTSRPILERLHFHHLTTTTPCTWTPQPPIHNS